LRSKAIPDKVSDISNNEIMSKLLNPPASFLGSYFTELDVSKSTYPAPILDVLLSSGIFRTKFKSPCPSSELLASKYLREYFDQFGSNFRLAPIPSLFYRNNKRSSA
jgi:hypothetical protein